MYKCHYNIQEGFQCLSLNDAKRLRYDSTSVPELSERPNQTSASPHVDLTDARITASYFS